MQAFGGGQDVTLRIRLQPGGDAAQQAAVARVREAVGENYEFRRVEVVGPRVSAELVQSGTLGVVLSIIAVLTYLWFRYEWQLAVAAVIATMHDLLLTMGFFALTRLEFNITSIAAILTIVGVSLNETVVVLDRIREMLRKYKRMPMPELIDISINAVLARTIMTSTTTLMALGALAIFGGHVIQSFSLSMMFGISIGVYSSIFICAPILIYLGAPEPARARAHKRVRARRRPSERGSVVSPVELRRAARWIGNRGAGRASARYDGFVPGRHVIEGYGAGGFRFAGMSHRGSILATPSGVRAIAITDVSQIDERRAGAAFR